MHGKEVIKGAIVPSKSKLVLENSLIKFPNINNIIIIKFNAVFRVKSIKRAFAPHLERTLTTRGVHPIARKIS